MIIAIDGPAGSGKGTVCKILASKYHLVYIDTGAMYRAVAYLTLKNKINLNEKKKIIDLAKHTKMTFIGEKIYVNGIDLSKEIRTMEVTKIVSPLSSIKEVREILVDMQREIAGNNDVIMEGRDITTVVFPNATYKFYLDATVDERARRRYKENIAKGINASYEEVLDNIKARDDNDMHKEVGALMRTKEQIYIDTTNLTIEEVVDKISKIIK